MSRVIIRKTNKRGGLTGRPPYPKFRRRFIPDNLWRDGGSYSYRDPVTNKHYSFNGCGRDHKDFISIEDQEQQESMRNINYSVNAYDSSDIYGADSMRFINQLGNESCYSHRFKYTTKDSFMNILEGIMVEIGGTGAVARYGNPSYSGHYESRYEFHGQNTVYVYLYDTQSKMQVLLVRLDDYWEESDPFAVAERDISVIITGIPKFAIDFKERFEKIKREEKFCKVEWKFMAGGRTMSKTIQLEKPVKPHTEFYPWLPCDIEEYFDNYLASSSNILLLLGPPGTGKTSFLRYMIHSRQMSAVMTYDEGLLGSDGLFVEYLTKDDHNMLLVEDADVLLKDRENAGNKIMSKLLNVSDGMIKLFNKKMAFTANIGDIDSIDSAILRPGRAFDVMMFRELTFDEAVKAAEVAGIEPPTERKDYSLADLFNAKEVESVTRNVEKAKSYGFGFTSGR